MAADSSFWRNGTNGQAEYCVRNSTGAFYVIGRDPLGTFSIFLLQIALIFVVSRIIHFLLKPLKQPKFVCNVLAGILFGPSFLGHQSPYFATLLFPPIEWMLLNTVSKIGVIYFVFIFSVKTDIRMVKNMGRDSWTIGILGCLLPSIAMYYILMNNIEHLSGFNIPPSCLIYFVVSVSTTYFPIIAYTLEELNLLTSDLSQLALSSALVNDILFWISSAIALSFQYNQLYQQILGVFSFMALFVLAFCVLQPMFLWLNKRVAEGKPFTDRDIVAILLSPLIMSLLADFLIGSGTMGPLLVGLVIPVGPPIGAAIVEKMELVATEIFLPLFYVVVGVNVNLYAIEDMSSFGILIGTFILGAAVKFLVATFSSVCYKVHLRNAVALGLAINIRGISEIIRFFHWKTQQVLSTEAYSALVLSALLVTSVVTPLLDILCKIGYKTPSGEKKAGSTIQSVPRGAELRILSCLHNGESVRAIITLLEASNPTPTSPICAFVMHLVELVGRASPLLAPYNKRKRKNSTTKNEFDHIISAFDNYAKESNVTVQPFMMIAPYKTMHEGICRITEDKLIPLIIVPHHENEVTYSDRQLQAFRHINRQIQKHATCSVGILVDRGLSRKTFTAHNISLNVLVIFEGGADDREALAFADRMSSHPAGLSITVMRILAENDDLANTNKQIYMERKIDHSFMDEFRIKNSHNACVVVNEVRVKDCVHLMSIIKSTERKYDLALVGRRRGISKLFENQMDLFVDKVELGIIGDVVASPDFCEGQVSVLVVQDSNDATLNRYAQSMSLSEFEC